ncbi:MAG: adenine deaminase C-terminal domain-containing protein [Veillonella caviae]|nr:adenine deaminase C-terminal domain-containing protein [Veillonella caviae]
MKCDLILKHGQVYNAYFKKFIEADVVIVDGKFFYIGDVSQHDFDGECLDVSGQYIVPGLIDCHMHIESSMTTPTWFAKEVLKHGVTTLIAEPHEIANVYGVEGIKTMLKDGEHCGVDVKLAIPSSVPSTSEELETTGGIIDEAEVRELLEHEQTICFGEVMNCRDLINDEQSKTRRLVSLCRTLRPELPIEGHCPAFMDLELAKILYQGVGADHTEQTPERMEARIQNGMFVQLQNKTLRQENIDYLKFNNLFEHFAIVTDDTMPHDFVNIGHLDALVRKAMGLGLTPEEAIYVTTYTPAKRMRLYDRGAIAPGLLADFIVLDSLDSFAINSVYRLGKLEYAKTMKYEADSAIVESIKAATESLYAPYMNSVHVPELNADDFTVKAPIKEGTVNCVLMKVQDGTTFIERQSVEVPVRNYELQWEETPYALACVIERHGKNGNRGFALVGGNALKRGAAATTYAHDHHNLLVLGQTKADMALAVNTVVAEQGGYIVVENEEILAFAPLKIAGILYNGPMTDLALDIQNVVNALHGLGYEHSNVIMSLSTLGLPVSPYVKVTDKGLIDVKKQCIIPLIEE